MSLRNSLGTRLSVYYIVSVLLILVAVIAYMDYQDYKHNTNLALLNSEIDI